MISASVGRSGINAPNDVKIVQCGLNVIRARRGMRPIAIDGLVGPETIEAISNFQSTNGLNVDGRMDVNGPTISRLRAALGSEAAIFGPLIGQLLPLQVQLFSVSRNTSGAVKAFADGLASELNKLRQFSDLAVTSPERPPIELASFSRGGTVIGVVGIDDATAAVIVIAFFVFMLLIIMVRSPAFRQAVEVRAKELDRIFQQFHITMQIKFEEAVSLIVSIANEAIDASNKCKQSPTFNPSPECNAAIQAFRFVADRIRKEVFDIRFLISLFTAGAGGRFDVREIRRQIEAMLLRMRQNAVDLQVELQSMREKCNCPEV
jgi:peptidoglycan hydrolase-like protein with peptidoglycan-binding domain